jgi:hypothetical protein
VAATGRSWSPRDRDTRKLSRSGRFWDHDRGKVDDETWGIWQEGMQVTFRLPWLQQTWTTLRVEYESVPGFCGFLEA